MRQLAVEKVWERDFGLAARRKKYIFIICGFYFCASLIGNLIPLTTGNPLVFPMMAQVLFAILILGSGFAAHWASLVLPAGHVIITSLITMFVAGSLHDMAASFPFTLMLVLVPAIASLLVGYRASLGYMMAVIVIILTLFLVVSPLEDGPYMLSGNFAVFILCLAVIIATAISAHLVSLNGRLAKALKSKGGFDEVTNLPNRYYVRDWINQIREQSQGNDKNLVVLGIGIDNFQKYNEKYGSQSGDEAMAHTASALQEIMSGHEGLLARNRGNSFIATVFDISNERANGLAKKALDAVAALKLSEEDSPYLTVSVGAVSSSLTKDAPSAYELIELAAAELQVAQSLGVNQISSNLSVDTAAA